jgi:hypothetical protein
VHEHIPEQEQQDAACERGEAGTQPGVGALDASERQAQENRESRYSAQCEGLARGHALGSPFSSLNASRRL